MARAVLILLLTPLAARAQLALFSVIGTAETPVAAAYNIGEVPGGVTKDVHFRAVNSNTAAIPITVLAISGSGFSITSPSTPPPNIAAGSFLDIFVHFAGGSMPAYYTATLQIDTISVLLQVTALPAPALRVLTGCTGPDPNTGAIAFGNVPTGQLGPCGISLVNLNPQSITLTALAVSGAGFQIASPVQVPLTIAAGTTAALTVNFAPSSAAIYSGLLTVSTSESLTTEFPFVGHGTDSATDTIHRKRDHRNTSRSILQSGTGRRGQLDQRASARP